MSPVVYTCNPKHRTNPPAPDCTIWLVTEIVEEQFFHQSIKSDYLCVDNCYWWLEINWIGKTDTKYAFMAKFKSDHNNTWHGYPITAERTPQDKPPTVILEKWLELGLLRKKHVNDIIRGRGYANPIKS